MAAGSRDRPLMLATGQYPQWRSRFLRYIDTRPNGDALKKCILSSPYKPTTIVVQAVAATDDSLAIPEHTTVETPMNIDEIYSTIDACQTAQEMWEAIERLQQGESFNIQDVKTNLFWEFSKFTFHDGEIMESYYTRFYKLINEMIQNNLTVAKMQINVQFLQQLQPEWSRDKDMQKNLALIAKYFKKIYKPTNNNLRTSLNSRNKNVDMTLRYKNDNQSGQFRNQRTMNATGLGKIKPKRVKDSSYHKEKMLLCKQAKKGVPLQAEQYDWLVDTYEEIDEQELEAHYSYMAKIQEVPSADTESDDERVALANLKLDVDENKKIQKKLKKSNTTLAQELEECKTILAETSKTLGQSNSVRDSCLVALQNKQIEFEKYIDFNDRTVDYDKLERKLNETLGQLAQRDIEIKERLKLKAYEILVVKEKHDELIKQSLLTKSHYEGIVKQKTKLITNLKLKEEHDIDKMLSMEKQLKFLNEIV
nr:hypothetical protein [Tanacetum cinerariifolium]